MPLSTVTGAFAGPSTATITRGTQGQATPVANNINFQIGGNNSGYSGQWILLGGSTEAQNAFAMGSGTSTNIITINTTKKFKRYERV